MDTLFYYWLLTAGLILVPVGAGMVLMGLFTRTFRAALIGVGCLVVAAIILLGSPHLHYWEVDRCLDAGGVYHPETGFCERDDETGS